MTEYLPKLNLKGPRARSSLSLTQKAPDDDGMDLLLRLRGYYFLLPPLRDKAPIPRWTDGGEESVTFVSREGRLVRCYPLNRSATI